MTPAVSLWRGEAVAKTPRRTARDVIAAVAKSHGLTLEQMFSVSRTDKIAHARFHAWWILHQQLNWSFPKIGRLFGKDHTSILHGVRRWPVIDAEMAGST